MAEETDKPLHVKKLEELRQKQTRLNALAAVADTCEHLRRELVEHRAAGGNTLQLAFNGCKPFFTYSDSPAIYDELVEGMVSALISFGMRLESEIRKM